MITHLRHVLRAGPPAVGRQSEVDANVLSLVTDGGIGADQIVRVEPTVIPSPSGSGELVLHGAELDCFVVLQVMSEGGGPSQPAIVTFRGCLQSVFGYPNDEAQSGDPRFHHGGYGFFEVTESPWLGRLQTYNRQRFPDADWWPHGTYRHYLMKCHESLGEFLAEDMQIDLRTADFWTAAATAMTWALAQ